MGIAQGVFQRPFKFANFQNGDAPFGGPKPIAEELGIGPKGLRQAFVDLVERFVDRWDQAGAHPIAAVGVVMDLQGIAPLGHMGLAHTPGGAGIVATGDGTLGWVVEADLQAALLPEPHHLLGGEEIPEEFIGDADLHGSGAIKRRRGTARAGSAQALGIGMAGHHQDFGGWLHRARADPVLAVAGPGAGEGVAAGGPGLGPGASCRSQSQSRDGQSRHRDWSDRESSDRELRLASEGQAGGMVWLGGAGWGHRLQRFGYGDLGLRSAT